MTDKWTRPERAAGRERVGGLYSSEKQCCGPIRSLGERKVVLITEWKVCGQNRGMGSAEIRKQDEERLMKFRFKTVLKLISIPSSSYVNGYVTIMKEETSARCSHNTHTVQVAPSCWEWGLPPFVAALLCVFCHCFVWNNLCVWCMMIFVLRVLWG